jgi:hypothetical protein
MLSKQIKNSKKPYRARKKKRLKRHAGKKGKLKRELNRQKTLKWKKYD